MIADESQLYGKKYVNIIVEKLEDIKHQYLIEVKIIESSVNTQTIVHITYDTIKNYQLNREKFWIFCPILPDI